MATAKPADPIGPLVLSGLADATAGVLAGRAARVVPLTGTDAGDLIRSGRAAPLLSGPQTPPPALAH